eukprot:TRINITY_DN29593_c0_g1_i2.p1 TRINITY_DN29593_c0_g1~~TRINITY_DN29593_c0_g1_i2.p1  ORF type:complete len:189 (-),score=14.41 TRINITY_DN29593_c0_g1_i2:133-660(-)
MIERNFLFFLALFTAARAQLFENEFMSDFQLPLRRSPSPFPVAAKELWSILGKVDLRNMSFDFPELKDLVDKVAINPNSPRIVDQLVNIWNPDTVNAFTQDVAKEYVHLFQTELDQLVRTTGDSTDQILFAGLPTDELKTSLAELRNGIRTNLIPPDPRVIRDAIPSIPMPIIVP